MAANDFATTKVNIPVTIDVLSNDNDVEGDPLIVTLGLVPRGTASVNGGLVTYTPATNDLQTVVIPYQVDDGNGGTDSATIEITILSESEVVFSAAAF